MLPSDLTTEDLSDDQRVLLKILLEIYTHVLACRSDLSAFAAVMVEQLPDPKDGPAYSALATEFRDRVEQFHGHAEEMEQLVKGLFG